MASQESEPLHWQYTDFNDREFQLRGRTFFYAVVLLSVILLVALLFLYARWICRFRLVSSTSDPYAAPAPPPPPQPRGLDTATINSFQIVLHDSSTAATVGESDCCICLGVFLDGDKLKALPNCRHCFHSECVDEWLCSRSNCPLCRSSLRSESPV